MQEELSGARALVISCTRVSCDQFRQVLFHNTRTA